MTPKLMCNKMKFSEADAWVKVDKHLLNYLNGKKARPQVHAYYCRSCKVWHTTTIPSQVLNIK